MKKLGCLLLLLLSNFIIAQIKYEKGYFIDNSGQKTECLIKNEDWVNNPETFKYKLSETDEQKSNTISDIKEFGVYNFSKYVRNESKIDNSNDNIAQLKQNKNPEWITKTVFLRLIVDGNYKLYEYTNNFQRRYFYSTNNLNIEQLIFKQYLAEDNTTIKQNKTYQQQLLNTVTCNQINRSRVSKVSYKLTDLEKYFIEANNCGKEISDLPKSNYERVKNSFNVKVKAGLSSRKLVDYNQYYEPKMEVDFGNKIGFRGALEFEYFLPFNKKTFSLYFEPSYTSEYKTNVKVYKEYTPGYSQAFDYGVQYNAVDLAIGPRYYIDVKNNLRIFLNAGLVYNYILDSNRGNRFTINYGLGLQYKKLTFDLGLHSFKGSIQTKDIDQGKYKNLYLNLGYKIFDK